MLETEFIDIPSLQKAEGSVQLPGSKSISNRVLLLSAFCDGVTRVHDLLDSDDTRVMLQALQNLGCQIERAGTTVTITGLGNQTPITKADLFLGNAGTAMRPLTAALAVLGGDFTLRGIERMHERPIGDLVDALRMLGCTIDYLQQPGFPPLRIGKPNLNLSKPIQVRGDVSSQFLTALLMALPLVAAQDVVIEVVGELISRPYIEITLNLLTRFGVTVQRPEGQDRWQRFTIPAGSRLQSPQDIYVEADASSASYFIALGAIAPGSGIQIQGVGQDSIQGDIRFVEAARSMGAEVVSSANGLTIRRGSWPLQAIDLDCNHIPDAAMTLAVMALYSQGTTRLRNIASWRVKETDRIAAMATELRKLGASVVEHRDAIEITPPSESQWRPASIETYDDHRMAMCFSLAAFNPAQHPVRIMDPRCVAKTFPDYFETFLSVCHSATEHIPVLCVDGPTASGKGTLAVVLAQKLGYHFLDSGSLYRITALAASQAGIPLEAAAADRIADMVTNLHIQFEHGRVWLNGHDVSDTIRTERAGMNASKVSAFAPVREALIALQQRFQQLPGLVADGRDMGTVIFPQARLKVFLNASAACRAERRYKQLISKGIPAILEELRADLEARDARDSNRAIAPLRPAEDALTLDNSNLSVDESVDIVLKWWQSKQPFNVN